MHNELDEDGEELRWVVYMTHDTWRQKYTTNRRRKMERQNERQIDDRKIKIDREKEDRGSKIQIGGIMRWMKHHLTAGEADEAQEEVQPHPAATGCPRWRSRG